MRWRSCRRRWKAHKVTPTSQTIFLQFLPRRISHTTQGPSVKLSVFQAARMDIPTPGHCVSLSSPAFDLLPPSNEDLFVPGLNVFAVRVTKFGLCTFVF